MSFFFFFSHWLSIRTPFSFDVRTCRWAEMCAFSAKPSQSNAVDITTKTVWFRQTIESMPTTPWVGNATPVSVNRRYVCSIILFNISMCISIDWSICLVSVFSEWKILLNVLGRIPARLVLYFLSWSGFLVSFMMRNDINIALVSMVRANNQNDSILQSAVNGSNALNASHSDNKVPIDEDGGEFDWSSSVQSVILGSFYACYVLSQVSHYFCLKVNKIDPIFCWKKHFSSFKGKILSYEKKS